MEEDVHNVLHQARALSEDEEAHRDPTEGPGPVGSSSSPGRLHTLLQTLLSERFLEELPATAVCILSGRQDCGPEAELAEAASLHLLQPLLGFVSKLRSQTCAPRAGDAGSASASPRMGESTSGTSPSLPQWIVDALSSLASSGKLLATLGGLVDVTITHTLELVAPWLQVPADYVKLALQFGIRTPSLDDDETCEQGNEAGGAEDSRGLEGSF